MFSKEGKNREIIDPEEINKICCLLLGNWKPLSELA